MHNFLVKIGFKESYSDPSYAVSLFQREDITYVNDLVISGSSLVVINEVIAKLELEFIRTVKFVRFIFLFGH